MERSGGFVDRKLAIQHCDEYPNDLASFGRLALPLNKYERATFYSQGTGGFTDYPFYSSLDESNNELLDDYNKCFVEQYLK